MRGSGMEYRSYKYTEGSFGLQEVIECLRFKTKTGLFQIKMVRTPNCHRIVSENPLVMEGQDYRHIVYASHSNYGKMYFNYGRPCFPDSPEGFEAAKGLFDSLLLEFHKMKGQASPKRWPMFKQKP